MFASCGSTWLPFLHVGSQQLPTGTGRQKNSPPTSTSPSRGLVVVMLQVAANSQLRSNILRGQDPRDQAEAQVGKRKETFLAVGLLIFASVLFCTCSAQLSRPGPRLRQSAVDRKRKAGSPSFSAGVDRASVGAVTSTENTSKSCAG